jgi:hypothetical protein
VITVHDVEQGSPEWHALRIEHPFTGAGSDKLLRFGTIPYSENKESTFHGNFYTRRGHLLEDEAIALYEKITGHSVSRPGFVTNSKYPKCGYSPDGHDDDLGIPLEVKAFNEVKHLALVKDVPMKVEAQIHFGQFIWEKKGARLLAYNPRFAKKLIDGVPNPLYDPAKALVIVDIPFRRPINNNFKRILGGVSHAASA